MVWHWLHVFWNVMHFAIIGKIFKSGWFWRKLIWKYSPLKSYLYYNLRISLFSDLINMNIQINIETLLFGNDTNTDQTNSFFLIRFFFIKQTKKVSSFRLLFCFFFWFRSFSLFALVRDSFVYFLFLMLCCIILLSLYIICIVHVWT